jgi:hypothetical protein
VALLTAGVVLTVPRAGLLILGAGRLDRVISDADVLLAEYPAEDGLRYLNWKPSTDPDHLSPEDLAVAILINSRVGAAAFRSAQDHGPELDLRHLPDLPLEEASPAARAGCRIHRRSHRLGRICRIGGNQDSPQETAEADTYPRQ